MIKYTKENIDQALKSVDEAINIQKKAVRKYYELKLTLLRINRALDNEFWLDKLIDKTERIKAIREYKELKLNAYGVLSSVWDRLISVSKESELYFVLHKEWECDQKHIKEESKTEESKKVSVT